jgi:hypothetical protein
MTAPDPRDEELPITAEDISTGIDLYFDHVSPFIPFIHRPTFAFENTARPLLMGMLCLGFQHGDNPKPHLASACFRHGCKILETTPAGDTSIERLAATQGCLLLHLYSIIYTMRDDRSHGLQLHVKSVEVGLRVYILS